MGRLYLRCVICERQQADGLLSGATWARIDVAGPVAHPAVSGGVARVCPWCQNEHGDWRGRAETRLGSGRSEGVEAIG